MAAKAGVDRSQGLVSGEQTNVRVLSLLESSSFTLYCAAAHALIWDIIIFNDINTLQLALNL